MKIFTCSFLHQQVLLHLVGSFGEFNRHLQSLQFRPRRGPIDTNGKVTRSRSPAYEVLARPRSWPDKSHKISNNLRKYLRKLTWMNDRYHRIPEMRRSENWKFDCTHGTHSPTLTTFVDAKFCLHPGRK